MPKFYKSRLASTCAGIMCAGLMALAGPVALTSEAHAAEPWPSSVQATYRIEFAGFDIGAFEFNSSVQGKGYQLQGDAKLAALLGAFKWQGQTRTAGALAGDVPKPAGYTFDYAGTGKQGAVKLGFTGDAVTNVSVQPPREPSPGVIPIKEQHLKSVLDPLSAIMALARTESANPCGRKLSLFDGKQRFDLIFSYKRQENIAEQRPSGQPGVAFVCKVKFLPIAGHKADDSTRTISQSNDIEVSFRPIPSANLFVPHRITVPTSTGTVRITAKSVRITTKNEQIAFSH